MANASQISTPSYGTDYNLEVLKGNVPGESMLSINGHNLSLTTTRITLHPTGTTIDVDQSGIGATPATVKVASTSTNDTSAGSGLRTVLLIGLDASGNAQTEIITMSGQTEVTSANTYSAITGARGQSWGGTNYNEGTVWVGTGTFTGGVPATRFASMEIQTNKILTAYYVVPTGKTLYLRSLVLNVATSNKDVEFFIETSVNGSAWITEGIFGMEPGEFRTPIIAVPGIVAGTHVRIAAKSSGASTDATAILGCQLSDN